MALTLFEETVVRLWRQGESVMSIARTLDTESRLVRKALRSTGELKHVSVRGPRKTVDHFSP